MEDEMLPKSKTCLKKEMTELQKLGERLVALSAEQLARIPMPDKLREAVVFARTLTKRGARRRQMQYIGTIMRSIDPEDIRQALDELGAGHKSAARHFQQLEQWRDALAAGSTDLIETICDRYPAADRQRLRQLARNAAQESSREGPVKARRSLFRYLREISEQAE